MKKLFAVALIVLSANSMYGQRYMTRTGKVSFYSSTPVENIEAFNNEVATVLDSKSGDMMFQVPVKSFKFEKELMQEHFNEDFMQSDKYPKADFKGKVTDIDNVNFAKDGTYHVKVAGKLTMHGVSKDINVPGTITVKGSEVTTNAKFTIREEDYGIKIPSVVSSKIAEKMEITVNAILTPLQK
ncbi:MAG: YceI family protein [Taibaiella sp.]|nr:YceI family protein [Taibaiella sp.]